MGIKALISIPIEGRKLGACIREAMQGGHQLLPQRAFDADVGVEVHIVSQNIHDGTRAALGVFIDVGKGSVAGQAEEMIHVLDNIEKCEVGQTLAFSTNPRVYLPKDIEHYYRYEGSLTTPDYAEDISWVVFRDIKRFPKRVVDRMIRLFGDPPRLPQPLNRRFVLANF